MGHHKRKRPKHQRAGCLMCKPHKDERQPKVMKPSDARRTQDDTRRRPGYMELARLRGGVMS